MTDLPSYPTIHLAFDSAPLLAGLDEAGAAITELARALQRARLRRMHTAYRRRCKR